MRGLSEAYGSWKIICMIRRQARTSAELAWVRLRPASRTEPPVVGTSWRMVRASVDLPQPDSPTRPRTSPCRTERLTPSTARTAPVRRLTRKPSWMGKWVRTSRNSRMVSAGGAAFGSGIPVDLPVPHPDAGVGVAGRGLLQRRDRHLAFAGGIGAAGGEGAA